MQKSAHDRIKDRMSYRHTAFQIDLTKVTSLKADKGRRGEDTHELEVEVDTDMIRRQGKLTKQEVANGYEDVVKSFADNIRILARVNGTYY